MAAKRKSETADETLRRLAGRSLESVTRRIVATYRQASPAELAAGASWYADANAIAALIADGDIVRGACIIAALSPRQSWARNVLGAREIAAGNNAPSGFFGASIRKAIACRDSADPLAACTGEKIQSFARNIIGDYESVTVDVWALRVALGESADDYPLGNVGAYAAIATAYRRAAARIGVAPAVVQAVTWCVARGSHD